MKTLSVGNVIFGISIETPIVIFTVERVDEEFAYCKDATFFVAYDKFISYRKETKSLIGVTKLVPYADEVAALASPMYKKYNDYLTKI